MSDGRKRWELIESLKTAWSGEVYEEPASAQVSRLQRLYEIEVKSGGRVAKRAVWRVNMRVQGGALRRSMWVDRENFLVLKSEIYRDDSTVSWRERVQKWEEISPEPAQFLAHVPEGWQTLPLNVPRHVADLGFQPAIPRWLPPGYFPLKARYEAGQCVIEYGDGIETLNLTQTMGESASHALGLPRLTAQGVLQMTWSQGGRTYRLDGGRAEDELVRVAESLK
jgi:hypothetical protein